jgi:hypothetical protein
MVLPFDMILPFGDIIFVDLTEVVIGSQRANLAHQTLATRAVRHFEGDESV